MYIKDTEEELMPNPQRFDIMYIRLKFLLILSEDSHLFPKPQCLNICYIAFFLNYI